VFQRIRSIFLIVAAALIAATAGGASYRAF
jgi:hypothetical protein